VSSPIQDYLDRLHLQLMPLQGGRVADYIPELAKADPADFGIAIATVDGRVYETGTTRKAFTIQSISKPLVYGVALEDQGPERVRQVVGVEPTGEAFNSISLEAGTGRPLNPMINAGAIATSSLVAGATRQDRLARVTRRDVGLCRAAAGHRRGGVRIGTGHRPPQPRHRPPAAQLRHPERRPRAALELYFKQCSLLVDCRDLALVASTLANGGVNPVTRQRAVRADCVSADPQRDGHLRRLRLHRRMDLPRGPAGQERRGRRHHGRAAGAAGHRRVLAGTGRTRQQRARREGLRGGLARPGPALPAAAAHVGVHGARPLHAGRGAVQAPAQPPAETQVLDAHGAAARVYELQGDLRFATFEPVLRDIVDETQPLHFALLDFKRVTSSDLTATRLLADLIGRCSAAGQHVVLTRVRRGDLLGALDAELDPRRQRAELPAAAGPGPGVVRTGLAEEPPVERPGQHACTLADHGLWLGADADDISLS
jgi:glutaminase